MRCLLESKPEIYKVLWPRGGISPARKQFTTMPDQEPAPGWGQVCGCGWDNVPVLHPAALGLQSQSPLSPPESRPPVSELEDQRLITIQRLSFKPIHHSLKLRGPANLYLEDILVWLLEPQARHVGCHKAGPQTP